MEGLEELLIGHILRLCSPSNRDRAEGLEQIVQISNEYKPEPGEIGLDGILKDFTFLKDDASPLIRKSLIEGWIRLYRNDGKVFKLVSGLLEDDDDRVFTLILTWIRHLLKIKAGQNSDRIFRELCIRVNDLDLNNRVLACKLLGRVKGVSEKALLLSLDKESKEDESMWCEAGAFVIALEDQFMAVRLAALKSLCQLSIKSISFARQAISLLIDAFNDETAEVRLMAVKCLSQSLLVHKEALALKEMSQLESVLCLLDDSNPELRQATRRLLPLCSVINGDGLVKAVRCLNAALIKFPPDHYQVMKCVSELGRTAPRTVIETIPSMLRWDKFYLAVEPRVEDLYYNLKAILVYNAMSISDDEISYPPYLIQHYPYFRMKYADCMPELRIKRPEFLPSKSLQIRSLPAYAEVHQKIMELDTSIHRLLPYYPRSDPYYWNYEAFKELLGDHDIDLLEVKYWTVPSSKSSPASLKAPLGPLKCLRVDPLQVRMEGNALKFTILHPNPRQKDFVVKLYCSAEDHDDNVVLTHQFKLESSFMELEELDYVDPDDYLFDETIQVKILLDNLPTVPSLQFQLFAIVKAGKHVPLSEPLPPISNIK